MSITFCRWFVVIVVLNLLAVTSMATEPTFVVSPHGDDDNPGTLAKPFATLTKAENWNPDTTPYSRMIRDITNILQAELKSDQALTLAAIQQHQQPEPNTVLHTVLDTVYHTVGIHPAPHPGGHTTQETDTGNRILETGHRTPDTGHRIQDTGHKGGSAEIDGSASIAPPSPPAKSGRSGRKLPKDVQASIDDLGKRAGAK